ncbi:DNA/RNA non-specific endonuclease [Sphingobacterium sp. BIGb0165]|uniref:DNA/RNA non-specific endonuclease n=1 Tax=Sphingobacterium sp. BIGb0165 TaxID=2940615 RepID=UPI0021685829|nr:DNA/RNA non-specific endonuclease [Sphingobacterium sp. BIGb0165]MCS4228355.1 endonuclease G [Sphingobacterium sp. BIGb0165]
MITLLTLNSCEKNESRIEQAALQFTPTIVGQINTKATGTSWDKGDQIGVYMIKSGQRLTSTSIVNAVNNHVFAINGSLFQSKSPIFLPNEQVDFIAYYPYKSITDFQYLIDLSDQSNQSALDFMYASNAENINKTNNTVPLNFVRQLSKIAIHLSITNTAGLEANQIVVSIPSVHTQGGFDLSTGKLNVNLTEKKDIQGKVSANTSQTAIVEFFLLPGEDITGKAIKFIAPNGDSYTWTTPQHQNLKNLIGGNRYSFDIKIDNGKPNGGIGDSQAYLEIPKMSNLNNDEVFIQHFLPDASTQRNYAMLYDKKLKMAYWVAYPLYNSILGSGNRTDAWGYDPSISTAFQPNLFKGFQPTGYDRGHQLPSADRNLNITHNKTTFYFTNMTAQASRLNQGLWANLETKVRTWTAQCDTMYVVTGAMPTTDTDNLLDFAQDNDRKDIAKPKYYFKALAMKKGNEYYTIAYKIDNTTPPSGSTFNNYKLTVSDLEKVTGFTFFPDLDNTKKESINTNIWK